MGGKIQGRNREGKQLPPETGKEEKEKKK